MRDTLTREQEAALDRLKATILDSATPPLVLAIDVPMRAAMLGVPWSRLRSLFDVRRACQGVRPHHRARTRRG